MALYMIGDLQGCHEPLQRLLRKLDFSPSRDTLYLLGDLVNRGPDSLAVLRSLEQLGDAAQCLLGNHDLNLLGIRHGLRKPHRGDTVQQVLNAPDSEALLDWLRHRSMAMFAHGWLMVHAGVLPQWSVAQTLALAGEVERALRGPDLAGFLQGMYGNTPDRWDDSLAGAERLRIIVNALTRMRFCTADGTMEFASSGGTQTALPGYLPWFELPGRQTTDVPIAFGHWSTLGTETAAAGGGLLANTLPLDTGCVWGGCLTAARLSDAPGRYRLVTVNCEQSQAPG
ncbi:symmetrical bis(5'-nucleosyl)-tetraphosphatase [Polaromonas eurypsychrophila]|uniref:Bis(5'-nucleosyl)-tetraphosphatase, symmetrical n=1 Tax=Polaromonas eurypsychrophila TaxID=1614635 RepID=A0A916SR29_9BURK|nr:symmetrical bis(5'-nucleosyl)-tetraphosphatase [Polaromonas eurypsychrophila]GGB09387.1 bis(5'-nucleosyl)-tetraphosphatase, symmetrical [Polaromonas eurypsychrophila]